MILRAYCDCSLDGCHGKVNGTCELEFKDLQPLKYTDENGKARIWWLCDVCYAEVIRRGQTEVRK